MDLLNKIYECNEDDLENLIREELEKLNQNSKKNSRLGFSDLVSTNIKIAPHNGFISFDSEVKYSNYSQNVYKMSTNDYFYEFAKYIKSKKINTIGSLSKEIQIFINNYFGITDGVDRRDNFFDELCFFTTITDDEYFEKLENIKIGDMKGANVAMCTERAALAQNLLTLFGINMYYCMGCFNNGIKDETHCFNIAQANNMFLLLDYSVPVPVFENNKVLYYVPFQGKIDVNEIEDILINGISKNFEDYEYQKTSEGIKKISLNNMRKYVVGSLNFDYEKARSL